MLFIVATLTPFDTRGKVDLARLRAHVLWLVAQGVDGFVPSGTTGEFLYLSDREREAVHRTVLDTAPGKPVFPCTWDPSPTTTAYLTDAAYEQGALAVLVPPPLYYRVDVDTVRTWYASMGHKGVPILAYHHPQYIPHRHLARAVQRAPRRGTDLGDHGLEPRHLAYATALHGRPRDGVRRRRRHPR